MTARAARRPGFAPRRSGAASASIMARPTAASALEAGRPTRGRGVEPDLQRSVAMRGSRRCRVTNAAIERLGARRACRRVSKVTIGTGAVEAWIVGRRRSPPYAVARLARIRARSMARRARRRSRRRRGSFMASKACIRIGAVEHRPVSSRSKERDMASGRARIRERGWMNARAHALRTAANPALEGAAFVGRDEVTMVRASKDLDHQRRRFTSPDRRGARDRTADRPWIVVGSIAPLCVCARMAPTAARVEDGGDVVAIRRLGKRALGRLTCDRQQGRCAENCG